LSHRPGDVSIGAFYRMECGSSSLPVALGALEEQAFLFQLQLNERPQQDAKEGLEVPLTAIVQWSTSPSPHSPRIYTHYRLPNIRLDRPKFVMMASCQSPVPVHKRFYVKYTLLNNLQDFLAVRLVWTPETTPKGETEREGESAGSWVVCHSPLSHLGQCRRGSSITYTVAFQVLRTGLVELSQHMKLKLQFTASVTNPPPEARPVSRRSSPGSPAMRDLMERHQASLGRSQSFSHQQSSRNSHLLRTGSVMERRAITPPVGSPVSRPLHLPAERAVLSVDKIAKRECKVLVVAPVK
uniref:Trafficking protein particle complex subunit 14 n=1 Tax=Callorhinchus milii TaxID=7868 RepID=A0A4W3I637_CALMI